MLDNLNLTEMLTLALYGFAIYSLIGDVDSLGSEDLNNGVRRPEPEYLPAAALMVAMIIGLNSAVETVDTFGGGVAATGVVMGNFNFTEVIVIAALAYAGYRAYVTKRTYALVSVCALGAFTLFRSNNSVATF